MRRWHVRRELYLESASADGSVGDELEDEAVGAGLEDGRAHRLVAAVLPDQPVQLIS